jgi:hypothetical protein
MSWVRYVNANFQRNYRYILVVIETSTSSTPRRRCYQCRGCVGDVARVAFLSSLSLS